MKNISFSFQFQQFFRSIYKQRIFLLRNNKSLKDKGKIISIIDKFQPYLYINWSNLGAARFIQKNYFEIKFLIPSKNKKTINELIRFLHYSNNLLKNYKSKQLTINL